MATILSREAVADGYDVTVRLLSGVRHTFHFANGQPGDVQAAVDAAEAALIAAETPPELESKIEIEAENGTLVG